MSNAVRAVARGVLVLPTMQHDTMRTVGAKLDPQDLPILGMLVSRVAPGDITSTLGISSGSLEARRTEILRRLALGIDEVSAQPSRIAPARATRQQWKQISLASTNRR